MFAGNLPACAGRFGVTVSAELRTGSGGGSCRRNVSALLKPLERRV